jgi:hypothetical protein
MDDTFVGWVGNAASQSSLLRSVCGMTVFVRAAASKADCRRNASIFGSQDCR